MLVRPRIAVALLVLLALGAVPAWASDGVPAAEVQAAVEKGLFFVERTATLWWQEKKCASCHDGPMLLFAHNIAKRQGIPVDQKWLDFWTDRWVLMDGLNHKRKDGRKDAGGMLTAPLTMLFRDLEYDSNPLRAAKWGQLVQIAGSEWQEEDGSWEPGGKLDTTPWLALALDSIATSEMPLDPSVRSEILDRSQRTAAWMAARERTIPERTENVAIWMVYEHRMGNDARAAELLTELKSRRLEDGTWSIEKASDSGHLLVTGTVFFALTSIGLDTSDPLVVSTQRLLLERQQEDGRWISGGRIFDDGSDTENPVFNLWATALICAGLSQTIELPADVKPVFTPDEKELADVREAAAAAAEGYTGEEAERLEKDTN